MQNTAAPVAQQRWALDGVGIRHTEVQRSHSWIGKVALGRLRRCSRCQHHVLQPTAQCAQNKCGLGPLFQEPTHPRQEALFQQYLCGWLQHPNLLTQSPQLGAPNILEDAALETSHASTLAPPQM